MLCVGYDKKAFWHSAVSDQRSAAFCLLLLHLIHRLPIPSHPVLFTCDFLDGLLIAIDRFEIGLQALGLFFGRPDFLDHDLTLMFKPDTGYNTAIVEEEIRNEKGSDYDKQGAAPRLEDLFRDALEPAGLLNSS